MSGNNKIEIKSFESSEKLKALVAKSNTDRNAFLEGDEISVFRGYVNDAESKKELSNDDKTLLKNIMGFTPVARSIDTGLSSDPVKSEAKAYEKAKDEQSLYNEVRAAFDKARGYDAAKNTYAKTIDEAYEAVKEDKAFSDKKYKNALKQLKYDRKHSIADAEAQEIRRKASLAVDDMGNIVNEAALNLNDEDAVRDAQIEYIKKQNGGKIDSRVKKALRNKNRSAIKNFGLWFSGNYSAGKQDDISTAHQNLAAKIRSKKYDQKGVLDIVGSQEALNDFVKFGLIKEEKGMYDITQLSMLYLRSIGSDATINEHDEDVASEVFAFKNNLYDKAFDKGFKDYDVNFTDEEILNLGEKLGYYDDHYHGKFVRTWQEATQGLATGAITGAAAGAAAGRTNLDVNQHTEVNIPMEGISSEDKANIMAEIAKNPELSGEPVTVLTEDGLVKTTFGKVTETALGIFITSDQLVSGTVESLWKHIGLGALVGGLSGAGIGILKGLNSKGREKECFGLVPDCNLTYEKIIGRIDHVYKDLKPEEREALKKIALLGFKTEWVKDEKTGKLYERFVMEKTENGECKPVWDFCLFLERYNAKRGNQNFNPGEARMAALTASNRLEKVVTEDCEKKPVEQKKQVKTTKEQGAPVFWAEEMTPEDNMNVHGHSWDSLAKLYDCFPKDTNKAKRMLKVMQGMQGKKLTVEQITELADISKKEVHLHYLRDNSGRVVKDKYGNPKFDIEDAKKQLEKAFEGKLPEGYNFNYEQCANALCAPVPGDNANMIVAPQELAYNDPKLTPCRKQAVHKPKASNQKAEAGNRGNAGRVGIYRNAVKDGDNPVQPDVSPEILQEAKEVGKPDPSLLKK